MDCSPPGSSAHGDSSSKNTGVGCHALLQGIFSTQGLNPGLLHCRQILYHVSHQGSNFKVIGRQAYCFSLIFLDQGFSALALLALGTGGLFVVLGCPMYYEVFSSICDPYPLVASSSTPLPKW